MQRQGEHVSKTIEELLGMAFSVGADLGLYNVDFRQLGLKSQI
jgi:hypothetical protein